MQDIRTFATFDTDLSASKSDVEGEPAGRAIAEALTAMIAAQGLQVDGPHPYADYGWEIEAWKDAGRLAFIFQRSDAWLLIADERTGLLARLLKKPRPTLQAILTQLDASLRQDARFRNLRWFTREEFERDGAA